MRDSIGEGLIRSSAIEPKTLFTTLPPTMTPLATLFWLRKAYRKGDSKDTLEFVNVLLHIYSANDMSIPGVDSSDHKDMIYALLGLRDGGAELGIEIRYSQRISVDEVFTDAAGRILNKGAMKLLLLASGSGKSPTLPSWTPDWRIPHRRTANFPYHELMNPALTAHRESVSLPLNTLMNDPPLWNTDTPNTIRLRGINIGTIASVGEVLLEDDSILASGLVVMQRGIPVETMMETGTDAEPGPSTDAEPNLSTERETETELSQGDNDFKDPLPGLSELFSNTRFSNPSDFWNNEFWPFLANHLAEGVDESEFRAFFYNDWTSTYIVKILEKQGLFSPNVKLSRETFALISTLHKVLDQTTEWYLKQSEGSYRHVEEDKRFFRGTLPPSAIITAGIETYWVDEPERIAYRKMTGFGSYRNDLMCYLVKYFMMQGSNHVVIDEQETCGFSDWLAKQFDLFVYAVRACVGWKPLYIPGGRIGMGPANSREGDIICVFRGTCPYVLRPVGQDRYQLIGDCYIYGHMVSGAVDRSEEPDTFHIV
jgi:hypothetical protein